MRDKNIATLYVIMQEIVKTMSMRIMLKNFCVLDGGN